MAKLGFSQSYTYFTWRNTKHELIEYLTELSSEPIVDFFRPNFFVNTPDINPYYLQTSGRPGFVIRAVLAATLSSLWGMYSGFELCESVALPGREEYLDSEKYEIRVRDYEAPGNIIDEITRLNRIRKSNPELQSRTGLTFCPAHNDQVLVYARGLPERRELILVAVTLDPFRPQDVYVRAAVRAARASHRWHGDGARSPARQPVLMDRGATTSPARPSRYAFRDLANLRRPTEAPDERAGEERNRWSGPIVPRTPTNLAGRTPFGIKTQSSISCTSSRSSTPTMTESATLRA